MNEALLGVVDFAVNIPLSFTYTSWADAEWFPVMQTGFYIQDKLGLVYQ